MVGYFSAAGLVGAFGVVVQLFSWWFFSSRERFLPKRFFIDFLQVLRLYATLWVMTDFGLYLYDMM